MPRKARKYMNSEFLHIMVQGLNKEYIFDKEIEKNIYLKNLLEYAKEFNRLRIIAYCIMNNHVHLLLFSKDTNEVSKFMKKVNTKYAIYYNKSHNRCGYVFRNRFRAEEIYTQSHLRSCINYIHNNPVKARMCENKWNYKYSSYKDYLYRKGIVSEELIQNYLEDYGIEYHDILEKSLETSKFIECEEYSGAMKDKIIDEFLEKNLLTLEQLKNDKTNLKKIITKLNIEYNFTQKEIAEKLEINKVKVNRILRSEI